MEELNFAIRNELMPVYEIEDEDAPISSGFWYSIDIGEGDIFINLLKDEKTKKACRDAIKVLSKLKGVVKYYVQWL